MCHADPAGSRFRHAASSLTFVGLLVHEPKRRQRTDFSCSCHGVPELHPLPVRACMVCGGSFAKRRDALVCGSRCRDQRKSEQQRLRERARAQP
jgi:hypothetical protein